MAAKSVAKKKQETTEEVVTGTVEIKNETVQKTSKPAKKAKKKFDPDEGIPCRSITTGGLYMEGIKSHILYEWSNEGDVTEVEYQDLLAAVRSNNNYINAPYFIIEDDDFLEQNPKVEKIYDALYSIGELKEVFSYSPAQMKSVITKLPNGAKESIKHLASQMIANGELDSVAKIKILDEIYGTQMMLMSI